ncbi:SPOR domain-containing protein [Sphingomonas sp. PAMC 26605]|uniref:SPOR domain-containing protein n=1 Tax=Sphingomonas sp. PAMC 26605 TaxID=1112214 RepID=UPI00026CD75D|nr:SPOR domain-containing protein [Sphingomonas sp. PAMC 26605]
MTVLLGLALLGVTVSPDAATLQRDLRDPTLPSDSAAPPQDVPPEVAQGTGPRGTSGEVHEDGVGYAALLAAPPEGRWARVAIGVGHPTLAPGTPVELTALDTGRTIVALVVAPSGGAVVALLPGAAQALGVGEHAGVRVRTVVASPQDLRALQAGQAASPRLDAPPTLLTALRHKLPNRAVGAAPRPSPRPPIAAARPTPAPPRPAPAKPHAAAETQPPAYAKPVPLPAPARGGLMVQVAALSSAERAAGLAKQLGGRVVPLGKLYRVQLGPFADPAAAQRARDGAARRGYADARIFHTD